MLQVMMVKAKILELLELILEETNEGSKELAVDVMTEFDTGSATDSMKGLWETQQLLTHTKDGEVKEALEKGLITYEEVRKSKEALKKGLSHGYHALRRLEDYQLC